MADNISKTIKKDKTEETKVSDKEIPQPQGKIN